MARLSQRLSNGDVLEVSTNQIQPVYDPGTGGWVYPDPAEYWLNGSPISTADGNARLVADSIDVPWPTS